MKICILSGGSGNSSILKALYSLGFNSSNIRIITNAYDNGKSTGVCRSITKTLGVSDIRKNHAKIFSNELDHGLFNSNSIGISRFYNERLSFTNYDDVKSFLLNCNLGYLSKYVDYFFSIPGAKNFNYSDFSISNIVYSSMYRLFGYEYTNSFFCDLLGIDKDCVLLNSFDNVYLAAKSKSGLIIEDEGDIVEWKNSDDKIESIIVDFVDPSLNSKAIEEVLTCDLLIISSGTFWSSIYPTLEYANFFKFIDMSDSKKLWFMNSTYDKDSYGVSSGDFINIANTLGLDTSSICIVQNNDASEFNLKSSKGSNIITTSLGNIDGLFDYNAVANFLRAYV